MPLSVLVEVTLDVPWPPLAEDEVVLRERNPRAAALLEQLRPHFNARGARQV